MEVVKEAIVTHSVIITVWSGKKVVSLSSVISFVVAEALIDRNTRRLSLGVGRPISEIIMINKQVNYIGK